MNLGRRSIAIIGLFAVLLSYNAGEVSGAPMSSIGTDQSSSGVQCKHYWEKEGSLVSSGRPVGRDVGDPPSPEFDKTGTYLCQAKLTSEDVTNGRYLFIGEVGDASYLEVTAVNGRKVHSLPINHGLSPNLMDTPVYTRYLPFVVSTRDMFVEAGIHEFKIRYNDLFPFQTGIRSGVPSIETFTGVLKKSITCSPAFTIHVFQFLIFVLLAFSFATWPKIDLTKRVLFTFSALFAACVILQLSAVPRSFLSQIWAIRLNDFSQLISFPLFGSALLLFFHPNRPGIRSRIIMAHLSLACIAVVALCLLGSRDMIYLRFYGAFLLFLGGVPCFVLGYGIFKGWLSFTSGPSSPKYIPYVLMILGVLYGFDICNLTLLSSRFYYFNHFLFYSTLVFSIWRLQSEVSPNEVNLREQLEAQNKKAYSTIATSRQGEFDTLKVFAHDLADLFSSSRVSIQEIVDGRLRFVGFFGDYKDTQGLHEIRENSLIAHSIETRKIQFGRMPLRSGPSTETDVVVVPLENNSKIIGVLCATDFSGGRFAKFYQDRMETVKNECEPVLALLLSERHNRSKDRLIQMIRNRTHPLQLQSEEYFLKNFDISSKIQSHAFIYGDLVGSVGLNERYKATNAVEHAIDEHLSLIWERFKHLGVVVSRTKGDMISFVVPNQLSDFSEKEAAIRCFEILSYISSAQDELKNIGKKHGISIPLQYRFAMSRVEKPLMENEEDESLRSFNLLVDEAIDGAARVISGVAVDGECIVLDAARQCLGENQRVLELDPQRLKGKSIAVRLWSINGDVLQNVG